MDAVQGAADQAVRRDGVDEPGRGEARGQQTAQHRAQRAHRHGVLAERRASGRERFRERRVVLQLAVRNHQSQHDRHGDVREEADHQRQQDGRGNRALRPQGFLARVRNDVEADEAVEARGGGGQDAGPAVRREFFFRRPVRDVGAGGAREDYEQHDCGVEQHDRVHEDLGLLHAERHDQAHEQHQGERDEIRRLCERGAVPSPEFHLEEAVHLTVE